MEKFTIGLLLGAVGGALLAANSCKMRTLVRKGQEEVKQRLDEMMDEKLKDIENGKGIFSSQSSEKSGEGEQSKGDMEEIARKIIFPERTNLFGHAESNFPKRMNSFGHVFNGAAVFNRRVFM